MTDRLTPERKAEIIAHLAATTNWSLGNLAARDLVAELEAVRAERDQAQESLDFLERNTLPDLRRQIQHHEEGKKRWRDRAENAEALTTELQGQGHLTVTDVVAWLSKKAREYRSNPSNRESAADALARMADKVSRGAIR